MTYWIAVTEHPLDHPVRMSVEGKPVKFREIPDVGLFCYQSQVIFDGWRVAEVVTGNGIAQGDTRNQAVAEAHKRIIAQGAEKVRAGIAKTTPVMDLPVHPYELGE